mmetsp:Transcript_30495/g.59558  ORF Transcript_30495/g.59558 Transcript_30495/m.59558 type:complete len:226 (+) Transcript_30495:39-716(+)
MFLAVFALIQSVTASISSTHHFTPWVAVFLNDTESARCKEFLQNTSAPNAADQQCGHMTVVFDPPTLKPYIPFFGLEEQVRVLAYGQDDYDQALLIEVVSGDVVSTNVYPHITISDTGVAPYTPVYSIVVWERLARDSPLVVGRDSLHNLPNSVSLPHNRTSWRGNLPPINSTLYPNPEGGEYPASAGEVFLLGGREQPEVIFTGTLCANFLWHQNEGVCEKLKS